MDNNIAQLISGIVLLIGVLLALVGWIWLLVVGFQKGGILWGILIFFFNWLAGLIFCIVYKTGWFPFVLMIIGGLIAGGMAGFLTFSSIQTFPR